MKRLRNILALIGFIAGLLWGVIWGEVWGQDWNAETSNIVDGSEQSVEGEGEDTSVMTSGDRTIDAPDLCLGLDCDSETLSDESETMWTFSETSTDKIWIVTSTQIGDQRYPRCEDRYPSMNSEPLPDYAY